MTIKIEAGRYYRTRDGRKVGPMRDYDQYKPGTLFDVRDDTPGNLGHTLWTKDGRSDDVSDFDLIAEWADTPDLTAIEKPFGLLDAATQQALKDSGGPWEIYAFTGHWQELSNPPSWTPGTTYRLAPRPASVTRDMWLHEASGALLPDDGNDCLPLPGPWTPVRVTYTPGDPASYRVEVRE